MRRANDWQRHVDYRKALPAKALEWLSQWEREEYGTSYERRILSATQAKEARQNKARQARDVLNQAVSFWEVRGVTEPAADIGEARNKAKAKRERKVKEAKSLEDLEAAKKAAKAKKLNAKKAQLEIAFVAYSTAVSCMEAAKAGDLNTAGNIRMSLGMFQQMAFKMFDEYVNLFGEKAGQELLGLGTPENPLKLVEDLPAEAPSVETNQAQ